MHVKYTTREVKGGEVRMEGMLEQYFGWYFLWLQHERSAVLPKSVKPLPSVPVGITGSHIKMIKSQLVQCGSHDT